MESKEIPRLIEFDEKSKIAALVMTILGIPLKRCEAIVIFPGQGEHQRVFYGIDLWKRKYGSKLLVAGISRKNIKQFGGCDKKYVTGLCGVDEDYSDIFVITDRGDNTVQQSNWVSEIVRKHSIKSLILTTALYHLPRAYLTLLKVLQKNNLRLILTPSPTLPFSLEDYSFIPGEITRISEYQKKGDVATFEELYDHLSWQTKQIDLE